MSIEIAIIFVLLIGIIVLFATERLPVDIVTLIGLTLLTGSGILTPAEAFAGFSNEILLMLGSIFVLAGALQQNGVPQLVAGILMKIAGRNPRRLTASLMLAAASASAFMNNTTVAAILVPPATGLARRSGISASKLLLPLAVAAILGGTCTLIGTSTNIAVSGYIIKSGMEPLSMFEILPVGLILVAIGIGFMVTVGWRMLPDHENDTGGQQDELRNYLAEVRVLPDSPLIGKHAFNWGLSRSNFRLVEIVRDDRPVVPDSRTIIESGDTLIVSGVAENLRKIAKDEKLAFISKLNPGQIESDFPGSEIAVVEAIILPGGELTGATLEAVQFWQRYGLTVLALHRSGNSILENLSNEPLREGDVLLLHGPIERTKQLSRPESRLRLLGSDMSRPVSGTRKGSLALAIFVAAIIVGSTGWVPMVVAFLGGALLVILSGCISADKAREFIDWRLLILIGGMTAFGTAMEKTGASEMMAGWVTGVLAPLGVSAVLAGFILLTILLTQPMSNAAAALVVLPVAMSAAATMGANPRTFAIGVMLAASVSFMTPLEPACLLVYGAGKYRMIDFIKIGGLLTLVLAIAILVLLHLFWSF